MLIRRIKGTTRVLGLDQGYNGLPVRDKVYAGGIRAICMAFEPTPEELAAIVRGDSIVLELLCYTPPAMKITTEPQEDGNDDKR